MAVKTFLISDSTICNFNRNAYKFGSARFRGTRSVPSCHAETIHLINKIRIKNELQI